jgi:hypothetical protein
VDRFVLPVSSQPCREPIGGVEQPSIAGFGGEQDQLTDGNDAAFIEQELKRAQIGFRKTDNAFLAVDDVAALQAAADRLSPAIIRGLGPKFSTKERKQLNLSRFYAIAQIEYCRNFIFKRNSERRDC